jgi:hypothetical protein
VVIADLLPETGYVPVYSQWLWYSKMKADGQVGHIIVSSLHFVASVYICMSSLFIAVSG